MTVRGVKLATRFDNFTDDEVQTAYESLFRGIEPSSLTENKWRLDYGYEIRADGMQVLGVVDRFPQLLKVLFPAATDERLQRLQNHSTFRTDYKAQLYMFGGFDVPIPPSWNLGNIRHVKVYTTEKNMHYTVSPTTSVARPIRPHQLIEQADKEKVRRRMERMHSSIEHAAGLGQLADAGMEDDPQTTKVIEGGLRIELTVDLANWRNALQGGLEYRDVAACLGMLPAKAVWYVLPTPPVSSWRH